MRCLLFTVGWTKEVLELWLKECTSFARKCPIFHIERTPSSQGSISQHVNSRCVAHTRQALAEQFCLKLQQDGLTVSIDRGLSLDFEPVTKPYIWTLGY